MERLVDFLLNFYGPTPYYLIFLILFLCGLGIPIPEDITLFAAGLLSYYTVTNVWVMIAASFAGVIMGDSLIFFLGAHYGRRLTKKWIFHKLLPDERLDAVRTRFHKNGEKLLFFARFMPGFRAPVYFSAGTLHIPFRKFILYDGLAALISVPAIVGAVYLFGDRLSDVIEIIRTAEHGILFVISAVILAIIAKWYVTHRKLRRS